MDESDRISLFIFHKFWYLIFGLQCKLQYTLSRYIVINFLCSPIFYKVSITYRTRIITVVSCFVGIIISQCFGYLSSYLNRDACASAMCAVLSAYGLNYSNYNSAVVILLPVFALILNIFTYIGAQRRGSQASMRKEINLVLITMIVTFVDVLLIACPNIILLGVYNKFWFVPSALVAYVYVIFCCNSAINLFVYIFLKDDFRNQFLLFISFGTLRVDRTRVKEVSFGRSTRARRIVPDNFNQVQAEPAGRS